MRPFTKFAIATGTMCLAVALVTGQQPGGLGAILGGLQQQPDIEAMLRNASVKKELKITDEQASKVPSAVMEALSKVLDNEQLKRLKQIELQQRGYKAFGDPAVHEALKLDGDQKDGMRIILSDADKATKSMTDGLAGGGLGGIQEKMAAITKETGNRCLEVLTADQKRVWNEMIGDEFKMDTPILNIGGGNFGKGGKAGAGVNQEQIQKMLEQFGGGKGGNIDPDQIQKLLEQFGGGKGGDQIQKLLDKFGKNKGK